MFPFTFFLSWAAGRVLIVLAGLIAVLGGIYLKGRNDGGAGAVAAINRQTEEAVEAAHDAGRGVDACYAAGGVWDVRRSKCKGD